MLSNLKNKLVYKIAMFCLLAMFFYLHLENIAYIRDNLDSSWVAYLAFAVKHHLIFGQDVIFTYGIFNQSQTLGYSDIVFYFLFFSVFYYLVYFILVIDILGLFRAVIYFMLLYVIKSKSSIDSEIYMIFFLMTYWILFIDNNKYILSSILLAILILMNVKFTFFMVALLPITALIFKKKYFAVVMFVLLYCSIWYGFFGNMSSLLDYFRYSREIATGYNSGMQLYTLAPYDLRNISVLFMIALYLLSGIITYIFYKKRAFLSILVYAIGFFAYKESIVRSDGHVLCFAAFNCSLLFFIFLDNINTFKSKLWKFILFIPSLAMSFLIIAICLGGNLQDLSIHKNYVDGAMEESRNLNYIKEHYNFPLLTGCSDLYPMDLSALIASGNTLCVRPVIQSYSAYTDKLLKLNAQHLDSFSAPDNIFWTITPIDNRYPTLDDSLSWPKLYANYSTESLLSNNYVLLKKRLKPIKYNFNEIISLDNVKMNELIDVSNYNGLIWATIDIQPNILEKFISLIYKPNQIHLRLYYADGTAQEYNALPEIMRSGFILIPTIDNINTFMCIAHFQSNPGECYSDKIKYIELTTPENEFTSMYKIKNITLSDIVFADIN